MKFETVSKELEGIPYILPQLARELYDFILETGPEQCLELGFGHGVSSCYIAAALDELGTGRLTTVDLQGASEWQKSVHLWKVEESLTDQPVDCPYRTKVRDHVF